jgi:hypothetical protein
MSDSSQISQLSQLMSPAALKLLSAKGSDWVREIGLDVVRGVVLDVLTGKNLRDSTEILTRRRIAALNLATVNLFLQGSAISVDFVNQLPYLAADILSRKRLTKSERWLAQWALGLTNKAFQNVLRDNPELIVQYRDRYIETCREVVENHIQEHGELTGILQLNSGVKAEMNWLLMTYLLNTIGAQTLAIRGSEKSAYGKLFEKLILGSLLHILDFKYVSSKQPEQLERVFWLSTRGERRESDATLLYEAGKGVRFDIGFIGRGNPEISLDKVTRFERELSLGSSRWYIATIIIVDRIGPNSRIERLARERDGIIIQMSAGYWPQQVVRELNRVLGFEHELANMEQASIGEFLEYKLNQVPLEDFIQFAAKSESSNVDG